MNATRDGQEEIRETRRGRLTFYHPNSKGTGSAMQLELKLDRRPQDASGCFFLEMASQKSVASGSGQGRTHATFAWERKATVKLDFADVCELLSVLEGRKDQVGAQGNGLFHSSGETNTVIVLKKGGEGNSYLLGLSRKNRAGEQLFKEHIVLTGAEAVGLRCVFRDSLFYMAYQPSLQQG